MARPGGVKSRTDAVTGSTGNLCGGDAAVKPERHPDAPKIVATPR
jgi:hypothetical protein